LDKQSRYLSILKPPQQPLSDLVLQSIEGNLPPSIDGAPKSEQTELLRMQALSIEELRQIARLQVLEAQKNEHLALLDKNSSGSITATDESQKIGTRLRRSQFSAPTATKADQKRG